MATKTDVGGESPGADLARMLSGQRMFLENVYSLMRFLETEVTKRGWDLVKNGGYVITRNGYSSSLTTFSDEWAISQAGIAFVQAGQAALRQGVTSTQIPSEGIDILVFQVRWLSKAPEEPVVWHARLSVEPEGSTKPKKWEDYQSAVFNKLDPEARPDGARSGAVKPGHVSHGGAAIVFTGSYGEVPVAEIETQAEVVSQLIEPALTG